MNRNLVYAFVPLLAAAALTAAGCSAKASPETGTAAESGAPGKSWAGTTDAPEFPAGLEWVNVPEPLSLAALKGKIVLLDFWTYGCVNCMHNLPYLKLLQEEFAEELVIIGVHSAKFANEGNTNNLRSVALRYGLTYPLVNDAEFEVWKRWGPTGWPTLVLIDPAGKVVGGVSGEGFYDTFREVIASLVAEFDAQKRIDRKPISAALARDRAPASLLSFPGKVTAEPQKGRLFIADSGHDRIVVANLEGGEVAELVGDGRAGYQDGGFAEARFRNPQGMALSADGFTLYVADTGNHAIRKVDLAARRVTTLAGTGSQADAYPPAPGIGTEAALSSPWDLVLEGKTLYAAMAGSHQIWGVDTESGAAFPVAGSGAEGYLDGPGAEAELAQPSGLALAPGGKLYFADSEASSLRAVDLEAPGFPVSTVAGSGKSLFEFGAENGTGAEARFQHPLGVVWADGRIFVADTYNHRIRRIDPGTGRVSTLAGGDGGYRDGEDAVFNEPGGISAAEGKLYLADTNNHSVRVVDAATGIASTLVLRGLERFETGFAAAEPKTTELAAETVGIGAGEIRLTIDLPPGYKPNPQAASSFAFRFEGKGGRLEGPAELTIAGPEFPLTIPASFSSGKGTLVVELDLVYCAEDSESLCLLERRILRLPFRAKRGAETVLSARYGIVD